MSKKARTATVAQNLGREHFAAPPRATHEHVWNYVRTNGNRMRRGCQCGSWTKWRRMTELEVFAYRPKVTARVLAQAVKPVMDAVTNMGTAFKEFGNHMEGLAQVTEQKNYARALLAQTRTDAVGDTAHEVDRITGEAGVTVEPTALDGAINDAKPGGFIAVMCSKHNILGCGECKMAVVNLDSFGIIDPPDDRDYSDTSIGEDFEPEEGQSYQSTRDVVWVLSRNGGLMVRDIDDAEACPDGFIVESGPAEFDPVADKWFVPAAVCKRLAFKKSGGVYVYIGTPAEDLNFDEEDDAEHAKDMCYLVLGNNAPELMLLEDAHQALDAYMATHPNGAHQIGDAVWDDDMGEWQLPAEVRDGTDGDELVNFVAESFGVDPTPEEQAAEPRPAWFITLDYGNDTTDTLSWDGWDYGASHLVQYLNTKKRGDLEFAARKLGIRGVTTKVHKELLIRALVAMADTRLVPEHALNRAAVMLYATPRGYASGGRVFDSDTEWAKHYAGSTGQ